MLNKIQITMQNIVFRNKLKTQNQSKICGEHVNINKTINNLCDFRNSCFKTGLDIQSDLEKRSK